MLTRLEPMMNLDMRTPLLPNPADSDLPPASSAPVPLGLCGRAVDEVRCQRLLLRALPALLGLLILVGTVWLASVP
jgi:hypothetical protein